MYEPGLISIKESLKYANDVLNKLTDPALKNLGGIIGDGIAYWRLLNLVKILKKVEILFKKNNISPQKINLKTLMPLIEYSSLEEDVGLSEKWAALLANAANPETSKNIRPAFVEILKELTPIEVKILDDIYNKITITTRNNIQHDPVTRDYIIEKFQLEIDEYDVLIENLIRVNLCMPPSVGGLTFGPIYRNISEIKLTALGIAFIEACKLKLNE